ncbi:MAG: hypothetical protein AAF741_14205 [Bacteroidota bacterium]
MKSNESGYTNNDIPSEENGLLSDTQCRECGGEAARSKGYSNAYSVDEYGVKTIHEGMGKIVECNKCKECGHSWIP